jgi:hypothetical protein
MFFDNLFKNEGTELIVDIIMDLYRDYYNIAIA